MSDGKIVNEWTQAEKDKEDRAVIQAIGEIEDEVDAIRQKLFKVQSVSLSAGNKYLYDEARELLYKAANMLGKIR